VLSNSASGQRYIHNVPEAMVSLLATEQGSIVAVSQSGKLYEYNGANYDLLYEGMQGAASIAYSEDGYKVLSSTGVYKSTKDKVTHQPLSENCFSHLIVKDREFVVTPTGMQEFKEGRYQLVNDWTNPISPSAKFHQFNDNFYLSNANAIYQYKSNNWKILVRDTFEIYDLAFFRDEIWAATDYGLRVMKNRLLKQVVLDGLDSKIQIDKLFSIDDDLYLQSNGTLLKWNPSDYQVHKIDVKSSLSNLAKDAWGDIWFADEGNIIQHKIGTLNQSSPIISDVKLFVNGKLESEKKVQIEKEGSDLKFIYNANHLRQPQDIKFQSLLSPFDNKYQDATSDRSIVYSDVPAGKYTYRLRSTLMS